MALGAIAIGFMAVGMVQGAMASSRAGRANQRIANRNALIARIQAGQVLDLAEDDVEVLRLQEEMLKGEQTAAFAGQGVDLSSDIVQRTELQTEAVIASEIATLRNNARKKAWGLEVQAQTDVTAGQIARRRGRSDAIATVIGGAGNIAITGAMIQAGTIS